MNRTGTRGEYAKHLKVSPPYITKLGKLGKLVFADEDGKRVDFAASDKLIKGQATLGKANSGKNSGGKGAAPSDALGQEFRAAQAQERGFSARLLELKFQRESGQLVSVADTRTAYARRISVLRDSIMHIPSRLAAILAAETDEGRIKDLLQDELDLVLNQAAEA